MFRRSPPFFNLLPLFLAISLLLVGCRSPQLGDELIRVQVIADGSTQQIEIQPGSTAGQALEAAGVQVSNLDKSAPPIYTVLSEGDQVQLTRVREEFVTEEVTIPFEQQIARNESLPDGETRLVQPGVNGLQELTYRILFEDDAEVGRSVVKNVIIAEAVPEIVMVGAQSAYAPLVIPGKLTYLAGGNAWLMEGTTANRRPLITSGDLDGRIFSISPDGEWLLFSRRSTKSADIEINTLWVVSLIRENARPFSLNVKNVVHSAIWTPSSANVAYTTVEPRSTAPGWQANNDVYKVVIGDGWAGTPQRIVEANSGGVYGWWGLELHYSPEGILSYARADEVGLVDQQSGEFKPLLEITPLQTHSDWAWVPGMTWGADSFTLYVVTHAPPPNLVNPEESPFFDLTAASTANRAVVRIVRQTGMFAFPSASALRPSGEERSYQVAYLQAVFPEQSETSRYRVVVMDRDGSNQRIIFPPPDAPGLEPQAPVWAPEPLEGQTGDFLALAYQGNLWLVDSGNRKAFQVTGDGLINRLDWK
ncbi:MAG: G5 domain-containing protein [Anaerolineales bacterium]